MEGVGRKRANQRDMEVGWSAFVGEGNVSASLRSNQRGDSHRGRVAVDGEELLALGAIHAHEKQGRLTVGRTSAAGRTAHTATASGECRLLGAKRESRKEEKASGSEDARNRKDSREEESRRR